MIAGSVGQGGANAANDVDQIQDLLNTKTNAGLTVDGNCGPLTIAAIRAFQAGPPLALAAPDGLITPGGPTYAALLAAAPAAPATRVQPAYPTPTALLIDLSDNNSDVPPIDFAALAAAGVTAVLLKASQGDTFKDPTFAARLARARAAGLLVAAYHFGTAAPVAAQLTNFTNAVTNAGGDFTKLVAAIDVEPNPRPPTDSISVAMAEEWVDAFRTATRATPLVYGGLNLLGAGVGATRSPNLLACPLWLAHYPNDPRFRPATLAGWADWTLWQFTDGTQGCYTDAVAGLTSDRSIFRGTPADLGTLWRTLCAP